MPRHRPATSALPCLIACLLAVALSACSGDDREGGALGPATSIDGVAAAESVPYSDDREVDYLRVTLEEGLDDGEVRATVAALRKNLDEAYESGEGNPDSLQVLFDGFSVDLFSRSVTSPDPRLERALWLREDGRATWAGTGPHFRPSHDLARSDSGTLVLAPVRDVAGLALALEDAVPSTEEIREPLLVGSPDGSMRIEWSNVRGALDQDAVRAFVALQRRLPGTAGWYDDTDGTLGVHLAADDISFSRMIAGGPRLLRSFGPLELREVGWGPLRARTFADLRELHEELGPDLDRLLALPGVLAVRSDGVEVADYDTLVAVRRIVDGRPVALVREPNDLIGFAPDPVVTVSAATPPRLTRAYRLIAGIDGVRQLDDTLVLERGISDAALTQVLTEAARVGVGTNGMTVQVGDPPILRTSTAPTVVILTADGFEPLPEEWPAPDPADVERLTEAWADVRADVG
ncbi:hypothetical protein [Nocardioides ferulae]|uniref:hypothetical protein n=1 Tax=Nocardioides ferulae TaxID=2340821 RepID=UPI000EB424E6|nr:hypothetical protein [Nocardioides ferulae]